MKDKSEIKTRKPKRTKKRPLKADSGGGSEGTNRWIVKMGSYGHNVLFNTTTGIHVFGDGSSSYNPWNEYTSISWQQQAAGVFNNFWSALKNLNGQQLWPYNANGNVRG